MEEAAEQARLKQLIENEVQLGQHILAVDSKTVKIMKPMPVVRKIADEKTKKPALDKETGEELYAIVNYKLKSIPTTFVEPMSPDLTRANLDQDDMRFVQALLGTIYKSMSYAERYNKWEDVAKSANFLNQLYTSVIDSSRAKDFRAAILAKSTIQVQEAKSKQWITEGQQEDIGNKKRWKLF